MKLKEYKEDSYAFSKSVSDLVKQFAFAGIALIWIFKLDKTDAHLIPKELLVPLLYMVITLAFTFLQYLLPSIIWTIFFRYHEKENNGDTTVDIKASGWLSVTGWAFYILKIISLVIGYIYIINFIIQKISLH